MSYRKKYHKVTLLELSNICARREIINTGKYLECYKKK